MNNIVKDIVRHIQIKNKTVAYSPKLFTVIIQRDIIHPTQYDESDDTELVKEVIKTNASCDFYGKPKYTGFHKYQKTPNEWGETTITME
jgi:hypothetical protein